MAPASAPVQLPAAAAVALTMAMALLLSAAAAAMAPTPIGQPGCQTTCGNVSVPYPFGFGPSHCYWPGLNLTCDTRHHPPQLLLGDGSLRVTEISLYNLTVRVMRSGYIIDTTGDFTSDGWNASLDLGHGFREHGYLLSARNELVVRGCNVMATMSADIVGVAEETTQIVSGCSSFCVVDSGGGILYHHNENDGTDNFCTGTSGCCLAPLSASSMPVPNGVQARWLYSGNHTSEQHALPVLVFVAEQGWVDKQQQADGFEEAPFLLDFAVTQGLPPNSKGSSNCSCSQDVQRTICKSEQSDCVAPVPGYACLCKPGYDGNPYLAGGCQDVDECRLLGEERVCFGVCINTDGSYDCQCPQGTYGNPLVEGGCLDYNFNKDALLPTVALDGVPTAKPNCRTSCGDVSVPYPFGFGHPGCYWPGHNLTCDTSHSPPRLLLDGNGTLQVVHISLRNSTVHVMHHSSVTNVITDVDHTPVNSYELLADVRLPDIGEPYVMSTRNEFIVISGWDLRASLHGDYRNSSSNTNTDTIISQAICSSGGDLLVGGRGAGGPPPVPTPTHRGNCTGHDGCCHAPIPAGSMPKRVEFKALNHDYGYSNLSSWNLALAFISEVGLIDQWYKIFSMNNDLTIRYVSSPIVLQWAKVYN